MRSGEVAVKAGVNVETLRYYERRGLLREPERRESGYRMYPPEAVRVVRFVKRAQELGFTLAEIEELLRLRDDKERTCGAVRGAAVAKMEDIRRKVRDLKRMEKALGLLVKSCRSSGSTRTCPILEALDEAPGLGRR